jgi:hypothetical protein
MSRVPGHENDLAHHASLPKELVRLFCLGQGQALRNKRLDHSLLSEIE